MEYKHKLNAGLLITGNEVLSAKTRDTNGPFIGMHLRKIGVHVRASMMCQDEEADILDCLSYLASRSDVILMTGGLGPTSDDLTAEVVAKFFGVKTIFFEKAWDNCLQAYKKMNRPVPESNKKQAYLPEGAKILANKIGTAVGFKVTGKIQNKNVSVYCMPGVPFEMEPMFLKEVYPELSSQSLLPIVKTWQVFFMGESAMQSAIDRAEKKLQKMFPAAISYQAHPGFVTYTVSLFPESEEQYAECKKILENDYTQAVEKSFHKHILYAQDMPVAQYVVEALRNKRRTLSIVEASCGGTLTKELSTIKLAEEVMMGSIVLQGSNQKRVNLSNSLWDDLPKVKQLEFMKADITLTEWGAPALEMATDEIPHGHFNIILSLKAQKIKNTSGLHDILTNFQWKKESFDNLDKDNDRLNYSYELQVSTRYEKNVQQLRVALHCICTLALIAQYL